MAQCLTQLYPQNNILLLRMNNNNKNTYQCSSMYKICSLLIIVFLYSLYTQAKSEEACRLEPIENNNFVDTPRWYAAFFLVYTASYTQNFYLMNRFFVTFCPYI